ncbi:MAG: type 1 glutamine amidotransferase [Opitutaceae bacterium]|nr:type 1 glutamine amidotransferase [Cytophagales bacterium]
MRLHYFQHEPFESPYIIEEWAFRNSIALSSTHFYKEAALPNLNEIDWLVIMGGSMSVNDEEKYSWLSKEKEFIKQAIDCDKVVIGICLGAQMIANVLGSKIYPNSEKEIGWFPIEWKNEILSLNLFKHLSKELTVMHWHGETFDLPKGAIHLAESKACKNQAFMFNEKVIALQFHMEFNEKAIDEMLTNCGSDLLSGTYVQSKEEILAGNFHLENIQSSLINILDALL